MGDPNPNHFLVHSALVLLRHWWCRDRAAKLPKSGYRGNQRNHRYRSANLRLVGQNVGFHRSSSSWCSSCFSDFFWKVVWNKKKRHTHTHWIQCFQQLEPFAWTPGPPKKINPPKNHHLRNKKPAKRTHTRTFSLRQLISHCPDLLELPTLCGSSITGMASSASQIASWGSQVAIACGEGALEREMVVTWETHLPVNAEVNVFGRG